MRQHENLRELCQAIVASGQPVARIAQRAKCREQTIYYWLNGTTYCGQHRKMADVAQALGLSWRLLRANSSSRG